MRVPGQQWLGKGLQYLVPLHQLQCRLMPAVELVPPIDCALEAWDLLGRVVVEGGRSHLRRGLEAGDEDEGLKDGPAREEHQGPGAGQHKDKMLLPGDTQPRARLCLVPVTPRVGLSPRCPHLEGSGVAVKKWTQGKVGSWGRTDTMLPAVRNPSESTQIPLALSRRMAMNVSAVM